MGETRHLGTDRQVSGIGPPRAGIEGPRLRCDEFCAEFLDRSINRRRIGLVGFARPGHQKDVPPALQHEILQQRIGKHRPARNEVEDIGATGLAAQSIVLGRYVEQHHRFRFGQVRDGEQCGSRKIGNDETMATLDKIAKGGGDVALALDELLVETETLPGEASGRVVVGDAEARAGNAAILRRRLHERTRQFRRDVKPEIGDADG